MITSRLVLGKADPIFECPKKMFILSSYGRLNLSHEGSAKLYVMGLPNGSAAES